MQVFDGTWVKIMELGQNSTLAMKDVCIECILIEKMEQQQRKVYTGGSTAHNWLAQNTSLNRLTFKGQKQLAKI